LIFSPSLKLNWLQTSASTKDTASTASTISLNTESPELEDGGLALQKVAHDGTRRLVVGALLAAATGALTALQLTLLNVAKKIESANGVDPALIHTEFNPFESYMMSFGIGCAVSTLAFFGIFTLVQKGLRHEPMPSAELPTMKIYGFLAGAFYFGSFMCQQGANNVGGSGSFGPASNACNLITAGLWGLLYFREVKGIMQVSCWVVSAAWTIIFVVLLSQELVQKDDGSSYF